jgi:hypothetical protein
MDGGGDEDEGGVDLMVGGDDGEDDATVTADLAIDGGSDDPDAGDGDATDAGGANVDGPDGRSASDRELCSAACMATARVAVCPQPLATCMTRCDQQVARGICLAALRGLLQCQADVGPEGYDCVPGGVTLKAGLCAAESKASVDCRSGDAGSD